MTPRSARGARRLAMLAAAGIVMGACARGGSPAAGVPAGASPPATAAAMQTMNGIAESYVQLALGLGKHDADYVDAYYGPKALRDRAEAAGLAPAAIGQQATALRARLATIGEGGLDEMAVLRRRYLDTQLRAMEARVAMLGGRKYTFDEESRLLYDAEAPRHPESHFQQVIARLESALPGTGPVPQRYEAWRRQFVIPKEKVDTVFRAAVAACRERTMQHVQLPAEESFTIEYVTGKSWSGYNWYQGNYRSLIQVNTDLPIFIDRALDLACHEGYPGHHVYNVLLEKHLVRDRGWVEFSVYPLFSPQSLIAEGSANYGVAVAFPGEERVRFERERLFPLAGLDPATAAEYYRVADLAKELTYAGNEAARRYLNGEITAAQAAEWINRYALMEPARAQQRVRFIDQYRSYVINYNHGEALVRAYVERAAGSDPARRWAAFGALLSSPRLPSELR